MNRYPPDAPVEEDEDPPISINQAAQDEDVHISTVQRWRMAGVRDIRLKTVMKGGRRMTRKNWIKMFHEQVTAKADEDLVPLRTERQRENDAAATNAALDQIGV